MKKVNYSLTIKSFRNRMILSQNELADLLGVCFASVNRWENGHHEPTIKAKRKIIQACRDNNIEIVYDNGGKDYGD